MNSARYTVCTYVHVIIGDLYAYNNKEREYAYDMLAKGNNEKVRPHNTFKTFSNITIKQYQVFVGN